MGLSEWFGWSGSSSSEEIPDIFPIGIKKDAFVATDVVNIFSKILTDVSERTQGLKEDQQPLLWDNCVQSESSDGLISLLAKAMTDKKDLFLVWEKAVNVIRPATPVEAEKIKADYKAQGKSPVGIFVSFRNFSRADMIKLYSALEYCTVSSLNKSMNLSKAIQIKMNDMRSSTSLADSSDVKTQALEIAKGLAAGKDVLTDAKDIIQTATPDLSSVKASIEFLNEKRAFYLGMPESYINGVQTGGLGTTGENDTKAIERGLKNYYQSIMKPVLEALFEVKTTYKSQDFRQIAQALEAMKTFELTSEEMLSMENKKKIVEILLDVDPDDNKGTVKAPAPQAPAQTSASSAGFNGA